MDPKKQELLDRLFAPRTRPDLGRVPFERLVAALRDAFVRAIPEALPPPERRAEKWATPDRLAWLGLVHEQERFYLGTSCGNFKGKERPGWQGFDWDETTRLDFLAGEDASRALDDVVSSFQHLPAPDGADEDEWSETVSAFGELAVLAALALVAIDLARTPSALPLAPASPLHLTVAGDNESPSFPAHVPAVPLEDDAHRDVLLATCDEPESRALLGHLLGVGGVDAPELLGAVQAWLDARSGR